MQGVPLTEQQRRRIVAAYRDGVSLADIAARFNISTRAVLQNVQRYESLPQPLPAPPPQKAR
jgi:predicted DNA-binding protein YlxM (UPF0122 family)